MAQATKIIVKKISNSIPEDTHLKSQFGGQPYFDKGEKWPTSKAGTPLDFVFQVYNEGNINLPGNVKLIQFYYGFDWDWDIAYDDDERILVKVYENINKDGAVIIEEPKGLMKRNYCEIEYEEVESRENYEGESSYPKFSQLGGYAQWVWANTAPDDEDFQLLFQLDSEYDAGLMWYDSGLVYVFYNPKSKQIEFRMQYY